MSSKHERSIQKFTDEYFKQVGVAVAQIARAAEGHRDLSVLVTGFSIRAPQFEGAEYLVVIRGHDVEGMPVVAFHSALDLGEAIRGVESRLDNGSLKWRQDEYRR